jgi:hypothetical protein
MSGSRAADFARQSLPAPTPEYSAERARQTNFRVEQLISGKISQDVFQNYIDTWAIPVTQHVGDDANFVVPTGTTFVDILLPVIIINTAGFVGNVSQFDMFAQVNFDIRHKAGANSVNKITIAIALDGVNVASRVEEHNLQDEFDMSGVFIGNIPGGTTVHMRVNHNDNQATSFDLTKSSVSVIRMTAKP